jgi:hypothetical protein
MMKRSTRSPAYRALRRKIAVQLQTNHFDELANLMLDLFVQAFEDVQQQLGPRNLYIVDGRDLGGFGGQFQRHFPLLH